MLRRGFQPSRLGAALVVMISLASGVWTLLSDDLFSVIFEHSTISMGHLYDFEPCYRCKDFLKINFLDLIINLGH